MRYIYTFTIRDFIKEKLIMKKISVIADDEEEAIKELAYKYELTGEDVDYFLDSIEEVNEDEIKAEWQVDDLLAM